MHTARLSFDAAPDAYAALRNVEAYLHNCGLEHSLLHLLKMRASQINHCTFCLDMHSREARRNGETEQRLYLLPGWRESPLYNDRERAALAWTEHLTNIARDGAPEAAFQALKRHFSDKEIADLTVLAGMINLWNRVAIGLAAPHALKP